MFERGRTITSVWPDEPHVRERISAERADLVAETAVSEGVFHQSTGPFETYERRVSTDIETGTISETTAYRLNVPWFGWLFAWPIQALIARRWHDPTLHPGRQPTRAMPWWAPPDQLTARHVLILGLLAAASMSSAFTNTLFTQTAKLAADDFGISNSGVGNAGSIVRIGIIITIPLAVLADRVGRQRIIRIVAWAAPSITALGALAPNFATLVATQAVGRPLGLALDFLVAVVAAEEMPRNSRAYAVSVLAMASGLGSGIAVMALPLADLGHGAWRLVYVVTLVWLIVAVDISRRLPETQRFERPHHIAPAIDRRRFAILATVAVCANFFVAPASFFQNSYLKDIRGFDATGIAMFTLITATPAGLGLIVGGQLADARGRRRLIALSVPLATLLMLLSFSIGGGPMWSSAFAGGFVAGIAYPAIAVYRAEMFPTGNRGRAAGLLTVAALLGGVAGIQLVGRLLDRGHSYTSVIGLVALGQLVVVITVLTRFPETAHRELEDLNPEDQATISL